MPTSCHDETVVRTLVTFHAHPDDESITTAGVMAKAKADGHRVVLVVATKGELGEVGEGVLAPGEDLASRRVVETHAAAKVLGVDRVEFLGYHDSGMMGEATNDDPACFWAADLDEAATTGTPTTSRCTASACAPVSSPVPRRCSRRR
jgi:LmbE family N-acetylglucosaminyl deacetylase